MTRSCSDATQCTLRHTAIKAAFSSRPVILPCARKKLNSFKTSPVNAFAIISIFMYDSFFGLQRIRAMFSDFPVRNFVVGARVSYNGIRGTVLYVGKVEPHEGTWLGVDWDNPSRGKHDGTYSGVQYFSASYPTSGSFVRPNKVDGGRTFMEAVREKYAGRDAASFDAVHSIGTKAVEFVGMEQVAVKQSQLRRLSIVVLDNSLVCCADDDPSIISDLLSNVVELHMCHTLLSDWTEVELICRHLNELNYLNLSMNKFQRYGGDKQITLRPLISVRSLILTECRMRWDEVDVLSSLFPNVVELGVCRNRITRIEPVSFRSLQSLDLDGNPLGSISNVLPLVSLKGLECLNLNSTGIVDFELPLGCDETPFPSLKTFYLCNNELRKWQTVNELNKLPALEHLLFHGNPLTMESLATSRQIIIAKIKKLKTLDRQPIIPQERRGAEIDYLRLCGRQLNCCNVDDFRKDHPRYDELCKVYGAPEDGEMRIVQTGLLKNSILDVGIHIPGRGPLQRKIPSTMTVQKLKALIGRICASDVRRLRLSYENSSRPDVAIALDNDERNLAFYSLESGDKILVNILPP